MSRISRISSTPLFEEWYKTIENFFLKDEKIIVYLKQNGMTKWTMSKTDDVEPIKVVIIMENKNKVLLKVENAGVSINDKSLVKGVSFEIKQGEIVTLIGPNGLEK